MSLQHVSGTSQAPKRSEPPFFCFILTSPAGGYALIMKLCHSLPCGLQIKRFEAVRSGGRSRNAITHRRIVIECTVLVVVPFMYRQYHVQSKVLSSYYHRIAHQNIITPNNARRQTLIPFVPFSSLVLPCSSIKYSAGLAYNLSPILTSFQVMGPVLTSFHVFCLRMQRCPQHAFFGDIFF